jgi:hypothetical protein
MKPEEQQNSKSSDSGKKREGEHQELCLILLQHGERRIRCRRGRKARTRLAAGLWTCEREREKTHMSSIDLNGLFGSPVLGGKYRTGPNLLQAASEKNPFEWAVKRKVLDHT